MRPIETSTDRLRSGRLTYEPEAAAIWGGRITIDLPVDPPAPRQHLVKAATDQMLIGKHHASGNEWDDDWVDAPAVTIQNCIDKVANVHLKDATGSTAHIWLGAERLTAWAILPTPLAERPETPLPGPLFKEYAPEPETYLRHIEHRALTPDQEAILPAVIESVRDILPPALQPHLDDISHLVAQEIPAAEDLLRAYQRTSIPEVLAEYDRAGTPEPLAPQDQQAVKTAQLSFPSHATEALTTAAHAVAATPSKTAAGVSAGPAFDR